MRLADIAAVVGGTVHDDPHGVTVTGAAFVDSRAVEPGGLFAAFAGERVDGHDYAAAATGAGDGRGAVSAFDVTWPLPGTAGRA